MKKNKFVGGVLLLSIFGLLSKVIGALYRIPLTHILGSQGMGLYQIVFPLYALLIAISSSGFPASIAKLIAEYNAKNEYKKAKKILINSFILLLTFSVIAATFVLFFSKNIAQMQGNGSAGSLYMILSPAIVIVALSAGFKGYFQGHENMFPTSIAMVVEQISKLAFGVLFSKLLLPLGLVHGVTGAILGVVISEIITLCFLIVYYIVHSKKHKVQFLPLEKIKNPQVIKQILSLSLPITIGAIIMPVSMFIDSALIVNLLKSGGMLEANATSLFGLVTGVVGSIINMPVVFSLAISTALLPLTSRHTTNNNIKKVSEHISLSIILNLLIMLPLACIMFVFDDLIIEFLYGDCLSIEDIKLSATLLKFGAFSSVYLSFVQVTSSALQGAGKPILPALSLGVGVAVKIVLNIILVKNPHIGILGAEISSVMCYAVAGIINVMVLLKNYKFVFKTALLKSLIALLFIFAGQSIIRKVVLGFASGRLALVICLMFTFVLTLVVYSMLYKNNIVKFLAGRRKTQEELNKI